MRDRAHHVTGFTGRVASAVSEWALAGGWCCLSAANLRVGSNQLTGTVPLQLTTLFPVNSTTWASTCITNCNSTLAGCDLVERQALIDFYLSTGGPYWTLSSGWMSSTHPCTWYGVTCANGSTTSGPVV